MLMLLLGHGRHTVLHGDVRTIYEPIGQPAEELL